MTTDTADAISTAAASADAALARLQDILRRISEATCTGRTVTVAGASRRSFLTSMFAP